ncbi:ArsR/SmtB family transcription factor [Georgenia sp. SUBG003]|uniref:ArsR/SmtB family transcription factor n=1 Tax=Georgenia sp. SUBG003 TaxID=1497974 RepID=UPI003AB2E4F2
MPPWRTRTRWQILVRLGSAPAPASASALAAELLVSRQAVAKHLGVLRESGLVHRERVGREVRCAAVGSRLSAVARMLDGVAAGWERRLEVVRARAEQGLESP